MFRGSLQFLQGKGYQVSREELHRQNRLAIRYFAVAGMPVALSNVLVQAIIQGVPLFTPKNWVLPAYFLMLLVVERLVLPSKCHNSTLLVYLFEVPVMVISILLGTVWDPTHQALTFPMFMSVIPIFILDIPLRVALVGAGWNVVFAILVMVSKDPAIALADYAHALEFYLLSLAVTEIVLRLRFEVVYNLDRANYHLEHDVLTDTRNRLSAEAHAADYVGKRLMVCMCSVDHLTLINDFYGNQTGNQVLASFAVALKGAFGADNTYRYGGDEFLCLCEEEGTDKIEALIEQCRTEVASAHFDRMSVRATLAFGYVSGKPRSTHEFAEMVQLANIYVHQAEQTGEGATVGGVFNEQALRDGIAQSNLGSNASPYETNQLTGFPALPYFVLRTEEILKARIIDYARKPVIGYLNMVNFRSFNEKHGYEQGDDLIRTFARLLKKAFPNRHLAYVSGSRFVIMCYLEEVQPAIDRMGEDLSHYMPEEHLRLKAGFVEYQEGQSVISLVDKARMAQQCVYEGQEQRWRLYDESLDEQIRLNNYLVNNVDQAIEQGWLKVFYQPIMWSTTEKIANLEALSRWDDPTYGMLPPFKFIGVLERHQLIYKLSLHVVRQAMQDLKYMQSLGLPLIPVSVNLSRNDFLACDMVAEIAHIVEEAGLEPWVLSIEITESAFAESQELLEQEVLRFHEKGFAVWMDDFGSEYSTLNLLEDLDFDLVKLDMRFMRNFGVASRNEVIVSSVIEMCTRLGMETLVEGVEEPQQREMLAKMGSGKLQGFMYSRPLPLDEVTELIKERDWV